MKPYYLDLNGQKVYIDISWHAVKRFKERMSTKGLVLKDCSEVNLRRELTVRFIAAKQKEYPVPKFKDILMKNRVNNKECNETLTFEDNMFAYVVRDKVMITVELKGK
jgi:hypothetical protein